jgi:hypothetical protein
MIDWLNARGAQVIEVDTDGIYFVPPEKSTLAACRKIWRKNCRPGSTSKSTSNSTPCSVIRRKITRFSQKTATSSSKGGALKSRGLEKFQRVFLEEMIKMIMQGKPEAITDLRNDFERKIRNREWKDRHADEDGHASGFA